MPAMVVGRLVSRRAQASDMNAGLLVVVPQQSEPVHGGAVLADGVLSRFGLKPLARLRRLHFFAARVSMSEAASTAVVAPLAQAAALVDSVVETPSKPAKGHVGGLSDLGISPWAKKIPKVKKTGDVDKDLQLNIERDSLIYIMDTLAANPSLVMPTKGFMERELKKQAGAEKTKQGNYIGGAPFPADYKYLAKIPRYWYTSWMVENSDGEITKDMASNLELADSAVLRRAFDFFTCTHSGHAWPQLALDRSVMSKMFAARSEECGPRLKGWWARAVRRDSTVDWSKGGAYTLLFDQATGRASRVKHVSGSTVDIPARINITADFSLVNGWSDSDAAAQLPPHEHYKLINFFTDETTPPLSIIMNKKAERLQTLAKECLDELDGQLRAVAEKVIRPGEQVLKVAHDQRRHSALAKARAQMADRTVVKRARTRQVLTT